jgi:hypothetical protein
VITLSNTFVHLSVKGSTEYQNLLPVDVPVCWTKRRISPGSESNASVICTVLPLLNFVKPVQTHKKARINIGTVRYKHLWLTIRKEWRISQEMMTNCWLTGECLLEGSRECRQHPGQGWFPQYQRRHFAHCQRTGITTRFMLLRPSLMGLGKCPSLISVQNHLSVIAVKLVM